MLPTKNGDSIHSWFFPSRYSSNYTINPNISEGQAKTALLNLQSFVNKLEESGVDYRYTSMPRDTFYALASYCMDLGEQISKLVNFERNNPHRFKDAAVTNCANMLIDLRNRIAHEVSVGVPPNRLYCTALEIVHEPFYGDAIDYILFDIRRNNPDMFSLGEKHVRRSSKKKHLPLFSKMF